MFPDTMIVADHLGGPLSLGPFVGCQEEVRKQWTRSVRTLASCPNVHMKLEGLGLRSFGMAFKREDRRDSESLASAWRTYIETCIDAFGRSRCMFESNFLNDKFQYDYAVGRNAFKRITQAMSQSGRLQLFCGTARRSYHLQVDETIS